MGTILIHDRRSSYVSKSQTRGSSYDIIQVDRKTIGGGPFPGPFQYSTLDIQVEYDQTQHGNETLNCA